MFAPNKYLIHLVAFQYTFLGHNLTRKFNAAALPDVTLLQHQLSRLLLVYRVRIPQLLIAKMLIRIYCNPEDLNVVLLNLLYPLEILKLTLYFAASNDIEGACFVGLGKEGGMTSRHRVKFPPLSVHANILNAEENAIWCTVTPCGISWLYCAQWISTDSFEIYYAEYYEPANNLSTCCRPNENACTTGWS